MSTIMKLQWSVFILLIISGLLFAADPAQHPFDPPWSEQIS